LKGKLFNQPIYKLLGGAWRASLPFYASIGGNGERSVDGVLRVVEARLNDKPAAVKIRFDNDCTRPDIDIPGHIAKARAVRRLVGMISRSPSTPITATRSAARYESGARSKNSAIGGSRSRCSTTM